MSFTKDYKHIVCDECGKFCRPYDELVSFGCNNPEAPEPLDPEHCCQKCHSKWLNYWKNIFSKLKDFTVYGDYQKSYAEIKMAKKFRLKWIHSEGIGKYPKSWSNPQERSNYRHYCYVTRKEYNRLKKLEKENKMIV